MSDQNPYAPPPGGSSPSPDPAPSGPPTERLQPPPPEPYQQSSPQPGYPPAGSEAYQPPAYQQPAYQQPYPQPGYQQPYPASGYAGGGDDRPTSTLAIVGFIVSLVGLVLPVAFIGFVLSLVALPQTGRGKKKGRGFAIAGAIIGGILTLLAIVGIILLLVFINEADQDGDGEVTQEELEDWLGVESGTTDEDFQDLFENEAAGPATVTHDPAALVVA